MHTKIKKGMHTKNVFKSNLESDIMGVFIIRYQGRMGLGMP